MTDFINVWLPGFLVGGLLGFAITFVVMRRRQDTQPQPAPSATPRIDRIFQMVDVALLGREWTGIVERINWDPNGHVTIDCISQAEFERLHRVRDDAIAAAHLLREDQRRQGNRP